jgi:hypothetical protein
LKNQYIKIKENLSKMNKDSIIFFDLDDTLWNIKNNDIWIIDKDKPYKPLIVIDNMEFSLIKAGVFKKDELPLNYNGNIFYISKDLFDIIKKKAKSENIERFGISVIQQVRKEILDKKEIDVLTHNIEHLRFDKSIDIGLLTARRNQKNHAEMINKLRLELKKINIEINKIFFVGGVDDNDSVKRKISVLLEHLIGLKIKDGKFIPIKQDWYKNVGFYDDDIKNINTANHIQRFLEDILRKTDDETFRIVLDRIHSFDLTLNTYLVVNNAVNRFKKNTVTLKEPLRFPLVENSNYLEKNMSSLIKSFQLFINQGRER